MVSVAILEMTAARTPSANRLRRLRAAAAAAAIAACLPYVALKVAWLTGSSVGSATAFGAASLQTTDTPSGTSRRSRWSSSR
jgi:hypothetical protein